MALTTNRAQWNAISDGVTGGTTPSDLVIRPLFDFESIMGRTDTPMLDLVRQRGTEDVIKLEWGEGDLSPDADVLGDAGLDISETTIPVDNTEYYQLYDELVIDDEHLFVTAVPTGTGAGNVTATRGAFGSTAATHSGDAVITILGPAEPEGVDAPRSPFTRGELFFNYPRIIQYTFNLTHRADVISDHEVRGSKFRWLLPRYMKTAMLDLDAMMLDGLRNAGDGSGTNPSTFGGLRQFTTDHVSDLSAAPLEFQDFLELEQEVAIDVGQPDMGKVVMGNYFTKRIFNSWYQASRRGTLRDGKFKTDWDSVETDFGVFTYRINYRMADDELFVWNPKDCNRYAIKGGNWATGKYTTQGWHDTGFLRGDFGVVWKGDRRRSRLHSYSTTESDYPDLDIAS